MKLNPRECLLEIFQAGLDAVAPGPALMRHVSLEGDFIKAGGRLFKIPEKGIYVTGGGKGAAPMALALENLLGDRIREGLIVVKYGHELELDKINILQAAHPVPDEAGMEAARLCLGLASQCQAGDLLICLLTGGASALLPAPTDNLTLDDLQKVTSLLLASGADIEEINAIRKHLSSLGGGRLVQAANGAFILALIVSDVLGNDPASIASGPASPDPYTWADCMDIIHKYKLEDKFPEAALQIIKDGVDGKLPDTPKKDNAIFTNVSNVVVASNEQALQAAAEKGLSLGLKCRIIPEPISGEAADYARTLLAQALEIRKDMKDDSLPVCLIAGGESTVTLSGTGRGGRNQEMALAAALVLDGVEGIYCLFGGTDGTDGPTNAAGGFANGSSVAKMGGREEAQKYLANHDSYEALRKAGEHLLTGPTRTNVMDMALIIIESPKA